jgi:hypothetical protein
VSQHKNFVGGEWVDSAGGETMEVQIKHVMAKID